MASIAAGQNYGPAKEAEIVAVKVLGNDGRGSFSGVVAAVNYVAEQKKLDPNQPMVASKWIVGIFHSVSHPFIARSDMSLGGSRSSSINRAVEAAIADGVVFVVSAGNDGFNACNKSPASVTEAITVSATDEEDEKPYYANFGDCVNVFA